MGPIMHTFPNVKKCRPLSLGPDQHVRLGGPIVHYIHGHQVPRRINYQYRVQETTIQYGVDQNVLYGTPLI